MIKRKYPLGLQDFEGIRQSERLYIDKTKYITQMIEEGKYFFLSRPRRFGKSMFASTLYYLFNAQKELFTGLYIEDKWDWSVKYPIIRIAFSNIGHDSMGLELAINLCIDSIAKSYGIQLESNKYDRKFQELVKKLQPLGKVVILIDEYDKPILDYLGTNDDLAIQNRNILKSFYSVLKESDNLIKFVFITGVTKFSKVSIFSELNNLTDLTLHPYYGGICGITHDELEENFKEELTIHSSEDIKNWYNGYTWDRKTYVYNPFSLIGFFESGEFKNFWFESGSPTFLVNLMLKHELYDVEDVEIDGIVINEFNITNLNPFSVLFQAGYLTIKDYDALGDVYHLVSPNREVRQSLQMFLINGYRKNADKGTVPIVKRLHNTLKNNDLEALSDIFNEVFAGLPYDLWEVQREKSYQAIIHLFFTLAGIYVQSEVHTTRGRLDSVIEFEDKVFLFEFKLDKSAEEAIAQIEAKGYADRFMALGKKCTIIGINFIQEKRIVDGILWKEL
jgi:Predicted AAA-ATPase/PD-(D/E)XK nuclease superfamily